MYIRTHNCIFLENYPSDYHPSWFTKFSCVFSQSYISRVFPFFTDRSVDYTDGNFFSISVLALRKLIHSDKINCINLYFLVEYQNMK